MVGRHGIKQGQIGKVEQGIGHGVQVREVCGSMIVMLVLTM
jgi:hypothetical protein